MKSLWTTGLLILSNAFMKLAWYGHLKFKELAWFSKFGFVFLVLAVYFIFKK